MDKTSGYMGPGIWIRISHRFGARTMEWFMAFHTLALGYVLMLSDDLFKQPAWSTFQAVFQQQAYLAWIMLMLGLLRLTGLIVNGARKERHADYRNVENFLSDNGVSADEGFEALTIAGLLKTNPVEAWARLKPTVQKLLVAAGEILPDDIQARVQANEMSREAAIEISRTRAANQSLQAQQHFERQRRETSEQANFTRSLMDAAESWVQDRRIKDPNYAAKEQAVQEKVWYLLATEGRPDTPEGVRAQLVKAYKAVNDSFRPPAPPAPPSGN